MTGVEARKKKRDENFNSHPHEEDDVESESDLRMNRISTHILTKRMTGTIKESCFALFISTHILTKRMTCVHGRSSRREIHFNSHPHEEDDSLPYLILWNKKYFNSHPHEEDDLVVVVKVR